MAYRASPNLGTRTGTALLIVALLTMGTPAVAGQQADPQTQSIDESLLFLDLGTVRAASRYEQDTRQAPSSITILTAQDIQNYGFRNVGEALNSVRGFWVNDDRNYSYLGVRGFSVPGDYNSRVLVLVDGHRANDSIYNAAGFGSEEMVDISLVERIEVIRGPGSSLYGTAAVFGVVNIVTRQGRWLDGGTSEISAGSWGGGRLASTYGTRFANGNELLVGASAYRRRGPDIYFPEFDDPASNDGVAVGRDKDSYGRAFAKFVAGNFTVDGAFSSRTKSIPTASYETVFNADSRTLDAVGYGRVRHERTFDDLSRLSTEVSFNRYYYDGTYVYEDGLSTDGVEAKWMRASSQYDRRLGDRNRLLVGGELLHNLEARQYAAWDGEELFNRDDGGTPWGVFIQDELRLASNVWFTFGLRHDHYKSFGGTTNPRLALVWTPSDRSAVKLLYGTAFRAPNSYELYYDDDTWQKASGVLEPERLQSVEAVVEHQFRPGLRATVSAFHMDLDGLVGQELDPEDGLLVYRNLEKARTAGIEIGSDYRSAGGVSVAAGYTFQAAADPVTDTVRYNAPRHLFKARGSVPLAGDRARASVVVRYVSSQVNVWDEDLPSYTVADLTLQTWLRPDRLSLDVSARNLFDAEYGVPPSTEIYLSSIPQDRRSVRFGIRVIY